MNFSYTVKTFVLITAGIILSNNFANAQENILDKVMILVKSDKKFTKQRGKELIKQREKTEEGSVHYYKPKLKFAKATVTCKYQNEKSTFGSAGQVWMYIANYVFDDAEMQEKIFSELLEKLKVELEKEKYFFTEKRYKPYDKAKQKGYATFKKLEGQQNSTVRIGAHNFRGQYKFFIAVEKELPDKK